MKIKKSAIFIKEDIDPNSVEDAKTLDPQSASEGEIADAVEASIDIESNGTQSVKDPKAIARFIKNISKMIDAKLASLCVENELTKALDECYNSAMSHYTLEGTCTGSSNLLVTGLPGSSKTAVITSWAKNHNIRLFYLNAKSDEFKTLLSGIALRKNLNDTDIVKGGTNYLDKFNEDKGPCVLFLDELNRADRAVRASAFTFINERAIEGDIDDDQIVRRDDDFGLVYDAKGRSYDNQGYRVFPSLLFTVAAINPETEEDHMPDLTAPERDRFSYSLEFNSDTTTAEKFLKAAFKQKASIYEKVLLNQDKWPKNSDKSEAEMRKLFEANYIKYTRLLALVEALFDGVNPHLEFDDMKSSRIASLQKLGPFSQRTLTQLLDNSDGTKADFLRRVNSANILPDHKTTINKILEFYDDPKVNLPGNSITNKPENDIDNDKNENENQPAEDDVDIFNYISDMADTANSDKLSQSISDLDNFIDSL